MVDQLWRCFGNASSFTESEWIGGRDREQSLCPRQAVVSFNCFVILFLVTRHFSVTADTIGELNLVWYAMRCFSLCHVIM